MAPRSAKEGTSARGTSARADTVVRPRPGSKPASKARSSSRQDGPVGTARTVIEEIGHYAHEHRRAIAAILALSSSALTLAALATWSEHDATWLRPTVTLADAPSAAYRNGGGWLGANVADLLYVGFGYGGWVPPLLGLVLPVYALAGRRFLSLGQWITSAWLWVMLLAGAELAVGTPEPATWSAGGQLGAFVASALVSTIGIAGAWLALVAAAASAASVVLGVSWASVARRLVRRVDAGLPVARQRAVEAGGTVGGWARGAVVGTFKGVFRVFSWVGDRVLGGFGGVGRWAGGLAGRAKASFTRTDAESLDDDAWRELTGFERPASSGPDAVDLIDLPVEPADPDTVPFADVEWSGDASEVAELFTGTQPRPNRAVTDPEARPARPARSPAREAAADAPPRRAPRARPVEPVAPTPKVLPAVAAAPAVPRPNPTVVPASHGAAAVAVLDDDDLPPPSAFDLEDEDDDDASLELRRAREAALDDVDDDEDDDDAAPTVGPRPSGGTRSSGGPSGAPLQPVPGALGPVNRVDLQVEKVPGLELRTKDDGRSVSDHGSLYFELPPLSLLDPVPQQTFVIDKDELAALATTVEEALASFRVTGKVTNVRVGPVVTIFEFQPDPGIMVRRVANLADDLALALRAKSVRVVAPIPGKGVVGIEIPSKHRMTIYLRELLASDEFRKNDELALPVVLGKDTEGRPIVDDLAKMPHLLVGGTTGSGKSVGVNGMLLSLLYTRTPEELRLLLIDPKKLEFEAYNGIPHLLHPVITEAQGAAAALAWACREMDRRYELLARWSTRSIGSFNKKLEKEIRGWNTEKAWAYAPRDWAHHEPPPAPEPLPYIVIVIDELADLMMVAKKDVQDSIVRLAQMARACGMHLVVATQRPSVDVVTGLIKSNLPTRISFKLRSGIDSRTILDEIGAEKLLGRGDMLLLPGAGEVKRVHGPFVSDDEVVRVIDFVRAQREPEYVDGITRAAGEGGGGHGDPDAVFDDPEVQDELYDQALEIVVEKGKASTSMIQRHLKIGYNRAARILDAMEAAGVVGPADGARPRDVLVGHD